MMFGFSYVAMTLCNCSVAHPLLRTSLFCSIMTSGPVGWTLQSTYIMRNAGESASVRLQIYTYHMPGNVGGQKICSKSGLKKYWCLVALAH